MSCDEIYWAFMISLMPWKCQWKGCPLLPGKGKINWMSSTGHQTGCPALATKLDIKLDVQYWPPNWTLNWMSSTGHQTGHQTGRPVLDTKLDTKLDTLGLVSLSLTTLMSIKVYLSLSSLMSSKVYLSLSSLVSSTGRPVWCPFEP